MQREHTARLDVQVDLGAHDLVWETHNGSVLCRKLGLREDLHHLKMAVMRARESKLPTPGTVTFLKDGTLQKGCSKVAPGAK
jgi:hypothetical protein